MLVFKYAIVELYIQMKSTPLTSTHFGKFSCRQQANGSTVDIGQIGPIQCCKFDLTGEKLYALDDKGVLISLSLRDNLISTLQSQQIHSFEIDSANHFSIWAVTRQSDLLKISFQNKQHSRIMNLNLNRLISFQKNHFTNLILALDYKILMVVDVMGSARIRSLKANNLDVFTRAKFASQNRFIVLAVRGIEIRIIEVLNLKTLSTLTLPFELKGLQIETSFDNNTIVVYGESNTLFVLSLTTQGKLSYELTELPFKSVLQVKFTYEDDIVILGSDRIVYGICPTQRNKLVPFYNIEDQMRISTFDINLSANCIAFVSNRTVHFVHYKEGLRRYLQGQQILKEIEYFKGLGELQEGKRGSNNYQYSDQNQRDQRMQNDSLDGLNMVGAPALPDFKVSSQIEFFPQVRDLNTSPLKKSYIQQIYVYLHQIQTARDLVHLNKTETIGFINKSLSMLSEPKKCTEAVHHVLSQLGKALSDESLQKFSLILAPRVMERVHKSLGETYSAFIVRNMLNLFEDYISHKDGLQILRIILKNIKRESYLIIFLITLLLQMRSNSQSWPTPHLQQIRLEELIKETENLLSNPKHAYIFAKVPESGSERKIEEEGQDLQAMLAHQRQLKQALKDLRREQL